jgi:hypothetical protein
MQKKYIPLHASLEKLANDYLTLPEAQYLPSQKPLVCLWVDVGNINFQPFQSNSARGKV